MVLDIDRLQTLLIKRGFSQVDARSRVLMLNDEQTKDFWLYREFDTVLATGADYDAKNGADVDYSLLFNDARFYIVVDGEDGEKLRKPRGTCYVIDEIHTHWPARGWVGTPRHVTFYNSQHAKLGDVCYFITQNTKLVDQNFLRLAQDFTYCRNHRIEKHGRFRGDNKFTAHTYPGPVNNSYEVTLNVETFRLDLELAKCYDTSAGVGMPGGGMADGGERARGIPLKAIWVAIALGLVGFYLAFRFLLPAVTGGVLKAGTSVTGGKGKTPVAAPAKSSASASAPSGSRAPSELRLSDAMPAVMQGVHWVRLIQSDERIYVYLSDGRVLTSPSRALYDAGGVVDVIDLEGNLWRVSRQSQWLSAGERRESTGGQFGHAGDVNNIPKLFK
jgi:hypothetical protein